VESEEYEITTKRIYELEAEDSEYKQNSNKFNCNNIKRRKNRKTKNEIIKGK
jgi:hypothetical protein